MKVVQILPELHAGGVERGTLEIAARLIREGHESIVISHGGRLVADLEAAGSRHIRMSVHRKSLASLVQIRAMRKFLRAERPDIVHVRSRVPAWITWLAWRGLDPDTRPRFVTTVHGFYSVNAYSAIMTRGERVIAVSESAKDYVRQNYPETPEEIIRVIPRGIDPEIHFPGYQPAAAWLADWKSSQPQFAGKCVLLLPGRVTRLKGHHDFLNLIAALKIENFPVHGLVVGDVHAKKAAYMDELRAHVSRLGIGGDVTFLGHRGDIREVMAASDVVFALSRQPESFGRTALEALALGKPVAGYDCGGVGELLSALFPAGRVPPGDSGELLKAARKILRSHPKPSPVGEPFTLETLGRDTIAVYRELADAPRD